MRHNITLDPIDSGWRVSGAVTFECARYPIVNAVAKMLETGVATMDDEVRADWSGGPTIASIAATARYKPSPARKAIESHTFKQWSAD
jgi:hypothetical protein